MKLSIPAAWSDDVDEAIAATIDRTAAACGGTASVPVAELIDHMRTSAAGGKRLRAMLLLAAHDGVGGANPRAARAAAAALELFQAAALVHDDLLDDSDTRRGIPAAHVRMAGIVSPGTAAGAEFGRASAVLLGDLALMCSHRAISTAAALVGGDRGAATATAFADMAELVTVGQYRDMRIAAQPVADLASQGDDIWATMRSKTASYSAEGPLVLGALTGGGDDETVGHLRTAGVPLGVAFQLRDDMLGLVGSEGDTGKPAGDDLREGKRTVLVLHAWTHGDAATRELISATLGHAQAPEAQIAEATQAIVATGAADEAQRHIDALTAEGLAELGAARLADEPRAIIESIFAAATSRTR